MVLNKLNSGFKRNKKDVSFLFELDFSELNRLVVLILANDELHLSIEGKCLLVEIFVFSKHLVKTGPKTQEQSTFVKQAASGLFNSLYKYSDYYLYKNALSFILLLSGGDISTVFQTNSLHDQLQFYDLVLSKLHELENCYYAFGGRSEGICASTNWKSCFPLLRLHILIFLKQMVRSVDTVSLSL